MSPEVVNNTFHNYTTDIWSLGVLLYELVYGFSPFRANDVKTIFNNIRNEPISIFIILEFPHEI